MIVKRIIYLFLLASSCFITAQTKTVVTKFGEKVTIYPNAINGLTPDVASGSVQLGGDACGKNVCATFMIKQSVMFYMNIKWVAMFQQLLIQMGIH